jgi:hypothetical protein
MRLLRVRWRDDGLERVWKEAVLIYSRGYPYVFPEILRKATNTSVNTVGCPGQNSNRESPKMGSTALALYHLSSNESY